MTRLIQFANNAVSFLAAGITSSSTSLIVNAGDGAKFPALTGARFFKATLIKEDGTTEVLKVTGRTGDTFTIVRAVEPVAGVTAAYAFSTGDRIELRLTAASVGEELDRLDAAAFISTANKIANYTVLEEDRSNLIRVDTTSGSKTVTLPDISTLTEDFSVIVAKVSADLNIVTLQRSGSDLINGAATYSLPTVWASAFLIADRDTGTWTAINSSNSTINQIIDEFTGSGTDGPFVLSGDPGSINNTDVFVGGIYQNKDTYTLTGTSITLGGVVTTGVPIEVKWSQPNSIGVPSDGSVTEAKLASASVSTPKLQDSSVSTAKLANNSVTTGKIPNDAVTFDKTQNIASDSILGRTAAGAGNIEVHTPGQISRLLPSKIQPIAASVAASALTLTLNPTTLDFRSSNLGLGDINTRVINPAISLVVPSGATLGSANAQLTRLAVLALDTAGVIELAVVNMAGAPNLDEAGRISTTAISTGSDSSNVVYSAIARTNVPYRVVGFIESTQSTAGTYATAPSLVQGAGGRALQGLQTFLALPSVSATGALIDFLNVPEWARRISVLFNGVSTSGSDDLVLRIGTSSGIDALTYETGVTVTATGAASANNTTGFQLSAQNGPGAMTSGIVELLRVGVGENTWVQRGTLAVTTTPSTFHSAGKKTLPGTLDRLRLTTTGGTDVFDAGSVSLLFE